MKIPYHLDYKTKRNIILAFVVLVIILLYAFKNFSFTIRAFSAVSVIVFFYLIDNYFKLHFKKHHYLFIFIIAITGFLFSPLYFIYSQYDKILHIVLPILYGSILFHMVTRLRLNNKWKLIFVFFVVVGSIALFEIGEYLLDYFFDMNLQGVFTRDLSGLVRFNLILDRIDDTIIDMILGVVGIAGYVFYKKFRNNSK